MLQKLRVKRHLAYVLYVELTVPLLSFCQRGATILTPHWHYAPRDLPRILVLLFLCPGRALEFSFITNSPCLVSNCCFLHKNMENLKPTTLWADSKSRVFIKIELSNVKVGKRMDLDRI